MERFFAILVEHYAGAFPPWLAPVQVTVLPVADRHDDYGAQLVERLRADGYRAELVGAHLDTLGARVRRAKLDKVPYVLVVGDDDVEAGHGGRERTRHRSSATRRARRRLRRATSRDGRRRRAANV